MSQEFAEIVDEEGQIFLAKTSELELVDSGALNEAIAMDAAIITKAGTDIWSNGSELQQKGWKIGRRRNKSP